MTNGISPGREPFLRDGQTPLEERDLRAIKTTFGRSLPSEFRALYLSCNGGYPIGNRVAGPHFVFGINGFNPIRYGRLPIEILHRDYVEAFPETAGYLPFAYDDGGNSFMLRMNGEPYGEVCLWLADEHRWESVSPTFAEFVACIYIEG